MSEAHWSRFYTESAVEELRWYEPRASTSGFVSEHSCPSSGVIDVGGGASVFVAELLELDYTDVTVLDLSAVALDRASEQLGPTADGVSWIHADITTFEPTRTWDLWHDRAVFHFLVDPGLRESYRQVVARAVVSGGVVVVSTFGPDGPEMCAGLPVVRYDADSLVSAFAPEFEIIWAGSLDPHSAQGDQRPYVAAVLRRVGAV